MGTWNDDVGEVWTQNVNSTFTINFKGVGISLVGIKDPKHGIYQVSVDNGTFVEVNANATTRTQSQTIYNSGVLIDGNHTLQFKIKTTDAQINYAVVNLGSIVTPTNPTTTVPTQTLPTTPTIPITTIPSNNLITIKTIDKGTNLNQFNFMGTWNDDVGEVWTQNINSTFNINFKGVEISLVGIKDPNHGIYQISIDNNTPTEINASSPTRTQPQTIYNSGTLPNLNHTLQFKIKSAAAQINYAIVNSPQTTTISSILSLPSNKITFQGLNYATIATMQFDITNKKLIVSSTGVISHQYLPNNMYFGLSLYDKNNNLRASSFILGQNDANKFASLLNGLPFDYGYYFKIYHVEPWRLLISGAVEGTSTNLSNGFGNIDFNTVNLYIQTTGLQYKTVDSINYYPAIGTIPITLNAVTNGVPTSGIAPQLNNTFAGAIGDSGDYITVSVTIPTAGIYNLSIQYLSGDTDRLIQIDINGINTGVPYIAYKTTDWSSSNSKTINSLVNFKTGLNTIKLFNTPNAKGPWIGNIKVTSATKATYIY
ncbi:MAG: putative mucin/carbohydrate-binding domain-containing protein, partial [Sarcina sp.]